MSQVLTAGAAAWVQYTSMSLPFHVSPSAVCTMMPPLMATAADFHSRPRDRRGLPCCCPGPSSAASPAKDAYMLHERTLFFSRVRFKPTSKDAARIESKPGMEKAKEGKSKGGYPPVRSLSNTARR